MSAQQYILLLKILDISLIIWLLVTAYSIYILNKRKGKPIVQIFKFYYWFAFGCGMFSATITAILVYIKRNLQYHSGTFESNGYINSATNTVIFLLIYTTISIVVQWMWSHYSIEVKDDRFVYNHLLFGKEEMLYNDIEIEKSKYCFISSKYHFVRFSDCETLYLVMRNGKEYKFRFDENIFFTSPFHFLYPKVREELGVYLDCIDLKYKKLSEAFIPPKSEQDCTGKVKIKSNDKIRKRKKITRKRKRNR